MPVFFMFLSLLSAAAVGVSCTVAVYLQDPIRELACRNLGYTCTVVNYILYALDDLLNRKSSTVWTPFPDFEVHN